MTIRQAQEQLEAKVLSPRATQSAASQGRQSEEVHCQLRTAFQRDRDRILYSKAFRRLKHKTQVFLSPEGDHYRTRLTHTLEVSQIGRTIARCLRLNEDLTEAIALGHDLGHTPFGHAGEVVLNQICPHGFRHNEQSLRVVDVLEKENGLNLTFEVRDGIVSHTGKLTARTLEGQIIKFADRIAYINHDIEDAVRGQVLNEEEIPRECTRVLGDSSSLRINNMIINIIENSKETDIIKMSEEFQGATDALRSFMFQRVYVGSIAKKEEVKAQKMIGELYRHFLNNQEDLPDYVLESLSKYDIHQVVCDYIAGMTDRYAIKRFNEIFVPISWQ